MAEGKLDLSDDLLSSKSSDRPWTSKVETSGGNEEKVDELKDQLASESSIPLSPQWLYAKPTEAKMDARVPNSVSAGNSSDPNPKEGWRLDGSEEKKDWRRNLTESESSRRWREEERETGLLSNRRDRRKGERRLDTTSTRETTESRSLSSADRWHDGNIRNPGHESRRDSKWSSRWGPEDREKESRSEKRMDAEREKEDNHSDNQPFVCSNRSGSERDIDSRDKWRPRHRMELHSSGSTSSRASPGMGPEKGRLESHNPGFTIGRGRSSGIGRSSGASLSAIHSFKSESFPGKPNLSADTFRYPRGKLLDFYRRQKLDPSFAAMPDVMEKSPPLTQVAIIEPLAFVAPDSEEETILSDIWKGKVTSSIVYNSCRQGKSKENVSEVGDLECSEEKQGILNQIPTGATNDTLQEAASAEAYQVPTVAGEEVTHEEEDKISFSKSNSDGIIPTVPKTNGICSAIETGSAHHNMSENWQMDFASSGHPRFDGNEPTPSFDIKLNLPGDSSPLFHVTFEKNQISDGQLIESNSEVKSLGGGTSPEEFTLFYIDPQGNTQGPFLVADIIMWFEQGFFGLDLPVRLGDSPEGTPFQELGDIMPQLKAEDSIVNLNSKLEDSGALGGNLEASPPASASVSNIPDSPTENDLRHPVSEFNNLLSQHVHSMISEPKAPLQMPQDQNFEDFVAQDEEIVFPGRAGNSSYAVVKSSSHVSDPMANSGSLLSLPNELSESGIPNQNDNKLHRFGLLWSELEGAQSRNNQPSNVPSGIGMAAPFGPVADPAVAGELWSEVYRKSALPDHNLFQDVLAAQHISHVEQESNHFDLAERFMSQQVQKHQFQQLSMLSPHGRRSESVLEHVPSQNQNLVLQQQLSNHSAPDMEHFLALEMQQQRQLQLQQYQLQQQQQQQQQQQFHQQQKLLQERQQSQVQQILIEQLLRGQPPDPGLGQSHFDPIRSKSVLDQVLLEQQLIHELQQQSYHHPRHVPSTEQLIQAKFGQAQQEEPQRDLFELMLQAQHGQVHSLEHQLFQQEQLQRHFSMGLRQNNEESDVDSIWPSDQTNQLRRNHTGIDRLHSSGFNPLDFYQQQQRPIHEEQLSHLAHNLSLKEQLRQGLFETSSLQFDRSMSVPAVASGINIDAVNAMARAKGLDIQELSTHMQSAGQAVTFSPGIHPHNPHHTLVPNQVHFLQLDANEGHWSESNGLLGNDWMEHRIQKLHINSEQQKRDSEVKLTSENPGLWMSDGFNDDKSRQLLMELLHQKSGHQPESLDRAPSDIYVGSSSSDNLFSVLAEQEAGINKSFVVGSYGSSSSEPSHISLADKQAGSSESNERLPFRAESGAFSEGHPFLSRISENAHAIYGGANVTGLLTVSKESPDVEWRNYGSKSNAVNVGSMFEGQDSMGRPGGFTSADQGEIPVNALSRHSSLGISGGNTASYNDHIGSCNSFTDGAAKDCVQFPAKAQDSMLLRHISVSRGSLSQEGLSDLISDAPSRGKNSLSSNEVFPGGRRDPGENLASHLDVAASAKKEMSRTSSYAVGNVSEASFINMLKSNAKKNAIPEVHGTMGAESSDGTQGGKGGKKKGKKGRQIDPALLGFKVTSNRIMMGEIQRIDD